MNSHLTQLLHAAACAVFQPLPSVWQYLATTGIQQSDVPFSPGQIDSLSLWERARGAAREDLLPPLARRLAAPRLGI